MRFLNASIWVRSARETTTSVTSRFARWTRLPSKWSATNEQLGQPSSQPGPNMKWYTINWLLPSKRSARVSFPLGPSNTYCFSTFSHGSSRRCRLNSSRNLVNSFSFLSNSFRDSIHSFGETTSCPRIPALVTCVAIAFSCSVFVSVLRFWLQTAGLQTGCGLMFFSPAKGSSPSARTLSLSHILDPQEFARPKLLKRADPPFINLADWNNVQRIHPLPPSLPRGDQLGFAQHLEMLHHAEATQLRKALHDLGGGAGTISQKVQNRPSRRI